MDPASIAPEPVTAAGRFENRCRVRGFGAERLGHRFHKGHDLLGTDDTNSVSRFDR
jgi:hypothetical protein